MNKPDYSEENQMLPVHEPHLDAFCQNNLFGWQPNSLQSIKKEFKDYQFDTVLGPCWFECKTDYKAHSGNLFFELVKNISDETPPFLVRPSDGLYPLQVKNILRDMKHKHYFISETLTSQYYVSTLSPHHKNLLICRADRLREWLIECMENRCYPLQRGGAPEQDWYSIGLLVPLEDFRDSEIVIKTVNNLEV